jgi:hypothetical protein
MPGTLSYAESRSRHQLNMRRVLMMKLSILFLLAALSVRGQTNGPSAGMPGGDSSTNAGQAQTQTNQALAAMLHEEQVRNDCINGRRSICGKILQILPDGLVVESGYTNLLRDPLTKNWLVPGTVVASRADNLIEQDEPGSVAVGRVFLTDFPKSRKAKPARYDYVIIEGYPAGEYTYTSLGTIQRTVRHFSAVLAKAVDLNLQAVAKTPIPAAPTK